MQERIIATVDPGSTIISLCVCSVTGSLASVMFFGSEPSEGISDGTVINPIKAGAILSKLITRAEKELCIEIKQVIVPFPRYKIRMQKGNQLQKRTNPTDYITSEEVESMRDIALNMSLSEAKNEEDIYYLAPQSFSTDDLFLASEDEVVGSCGSELGINYDIMFGPSRAAKNLELMATSCGKNLAARYFMPAKMGEVILTEDELENGAALVEIGGGVTSVSIYNKGMLRYYASIPFGGKSVTNDIRTESGFSESLSENIKLAYGFGMPSRLSNMGEKVLEVLDERNGETNRLTIKYLCEIINSRMSEIAQAILYKIGESGYSDRLRGGIVLCGGGAEVVNCSALFHEQSGCKVRVGYAHSSTIETGGFPEMDEPSAQTHYGMISLAVADEYINCSERIDKEPMINFEPEVVPEPVVIPEPKPAVPKPAAPTQEPEPFQEPVPEPEPEPERYFEEEFPFKKIKFPSVPKFRPSLASNPFLKSLFQNINKSYRALDDNNNE